jgi:LacI family transcriptional regulator
MVTIYDVAKRAGVGIATVSRVLNDAPSVSEAKRQKVLKAIEELNYQPNSTARNLARGDTYTIGVMSPFISQPWFSDRIKGIQDTLTPTDYDLVVFSIGTPEQMMQQFNSMSKFKFVSGMIIISMGVVDEDVQRFQQWKVPVVLLDSDHPELSSVIIDDVGGGFRATRHLIELGHQCIAFVGGEFSSPFRFTTDAERYQGYAKALHEAGVPVSQDYIFTSAYDHDSGYAAAKQLLTLPTPPTAVFAANDVVALGVLEAAVDAGLKIPDDLSIIGHDDNMLANYYQLTTVFQSFYQSGIHAANLLLNILNDNATERQSITVRGDLILRNSTAAPRETISR